MKVLVLKGEGLNCENETAFIFERLGAQVTKRHVRDFLENPNELLENHVFALPGGFSFGDEIQSGHLLALSLSKALKGIWSQFLAEKRLVLGICNGFQVLMKMNAFEENRTIALVENTPHGFIDRWVSLRVHESFCVWTKGLSGQELFLPIRHGEGRVWSSQKGTETIRGKIALSYVDDVNGSLENIAGLTDATGQILGLMPHPEAASISWLLPEDNKDKADLNYKIFENALHYIKENHHA
ncbi:MAG: phosphoribosylformylglycinamidine synthase subunit PurQ [Bacteriovoracaceae bacterium]|nr:phosphoribosylformylglycinamidine synthase subunit PurQ [Bacteriovoracaceae bacterium]